MISFLPIIEQLQAGGCDHAEAVMEYAGIKDTPRRDVSHFVLPDRDSAGANRLDRGVDQQITLTFQVLIAVRTSARKRGQTVEELKPHSDRVDDALLGWYHPEASGPAEYAGGALVLATQGLTVWQSRYTLTYRKRRV